MSSPRKRIKLEKQVGRTPSPKKMSGRTNSRGKQRSIRRKSREKVIGANISEEVTPSNSYQYSTPVSKIRSNERYNLRQSTSGSRDGAQARGSKTPLRTLSRTPACKPGRTPGTVGRRKDFSLRVDSSPTKDVGDVHNREVLKAELKQITNKSLKVSFIGEMANFKFQNKRLMQKYEKILKAKVADVYPSADLTVSLSTLSCIIDNEPNIVDAVKLEINSLQFLEDAEDDKEVTIYRAWLFRNFEKNEDEFPVMLYHGREKIQNTVSGWLQGSFDCNVTHFGVTQTDMVWIAGAWSGRPCWKKSHQEGKYCKVDMIYHIHTPHGMDHFPSPNNKGKSKISMTIDLNIVHHIWNSIVEVSKGKLEESELNEFFCTMNALVEKGTLIPTHLLRLHQLVTPCLNIRSDGYLRVSCDTSVRVLVKHLMDIFNQSSGQ